MILATLVGCSTSTQQAQDAWPLASIGYGLGFASIDYGDNIQSLDISQFESWMEPGAADDSLDSVGIETQGEQGYWRSAYQQTLVKVDDDAIHPFVWEAHVNHPRVQNWLNYFQGAGQPWFERSMNRLKNYMPMIEVIAKKYNVFPGIAALAFVESGINPAAISRVGAAGMWQFMRATGKQYGLHIDYWVDARLDPLRATEAAIRHLRDLYKRFNSWPLAFAAYNGGPGRVSRMIRLGQSSDYWNLIDRNFFPRETRNYVPKIVAVTHLLDTYGVRPTTETSMHPVEVPPMSDLTRLAWFEMVDVQEIASDNPAFRVGTTPPGETSYVWIRKPEGVRDYAHSATVTNWLTETYNYTVRNSASPLVLEEEWGIPAKVTAELNEVGVQKTFSSGDTIRLPVGAEVSLASIKSREERIVHKVRSGETLSHIARKHRTSVRKIRAYNGLRNSRIYPGQRLVVKTRPAIGNWAKYADSDS